MKRNLNRWVKNESGITALETAIILIAFVVVAAIFAFTVLTTGTFLTERSKEAAYAGLQEVRGSMELKGSVVLNSTGKAVQFNVATVAGGSSQDLSKVNMTFRTNTVNKEFSLSSTDCSSAAEASVTEKWSAAQPSGSVLEDCILKAGNMAKITVYLDTALDIGPNDTFGLELKPPTGGVMLIERTAPAQIDQVTDLH